MQSFSSNTFTFLALLPLPPPLYQSRMSIPQDPCNPFSSYGAAFSAPCSNAPPHGALGQIPSDLFYWHFSLFDDFPHLYSECSLKFVLCTNSTDLRSLSASPARIFYTHHLSLVFPPPCYPPPYDPKPFFRPSVLYP